MTLWRYSPGRMDANLLESIFVFRHGLADRLEELIVESATTRSKHFKLLVGPRGIGKTYLLALLHHRVQARDDLAGGLVVAWLDENSWGVTTATHLFVAIARTLSARDASGEVETKLTRLLEIPRAQQETYARQIVMETVGDRTLLLLIENLDEVLDALGDAGQKALRSFLQDERRCCIVATARSLSRDLTDRESPFYGFFSIEPLPPLTAEAATDLLVRIARVRGDEELAAQLTTPLGRGRVRALNRLAEGNPRFFVILSEFLTCAELVDFARPLLRTLDELTPYYEERLMSVSRQQRMIAAYLCDREGPAPVKQIARECFITEQTTSSQLRELRERGLVDDLRVGRETYYDVREPLMRLVINGKRTGEDPRLDLIRFLRDWHTDSEPEADGETAADSPVALLAEGKIDEGLDALREASTGTEAAEEPGLCDQTRQIVSNLLSRTPTPESWQRVIPGLVETFSQEGGGLSRLGEALVRSVRALRVPLLGAEARTLWRDLWHEAAASHPAMALPLHLLDAAVTYLATEDRRVLVELNRLEREPLAELLDLDPETLEPLAGV